MSKATQPFHSIHAANNQLGGARRSKTARSRHLYACLHWAHDHHFEVAHVRDLQLVHVQGYVNSLLGGEPIRRKKGKIIQRKPILQATAHNVVGSIRRALSAFQVEADVVGITAANLGLAPKSREGKKHPVTDRLFDEAIRQARARGEQGIAIALSLERYLGYRAEEGMRSTTQLRLWLKEAAQSAQDELPAVRVVDGTKGGRIRTTCVIKKYAQATLDVMLEAITYMQSHPNLVEGKKAGLKQAKAHYHYVCASLGLTGRWAPHSFRYRYTIDNLEELRLAGVPRTEAFRLCAEFLGHGGGRDRWVRMVYGRSIVGRYPKTTRKQDWAALAREVSDFYVEKNLPRYLRNPVQSTTAIVN